MGEPRTPRLHYGTLQVFFFFFSNETMWQSITSRKVPLGKMAICWPQRYIMIIADNKKGRPTPTVIHMRGCIKMFIDAVLAAPPPAESSKANTTTADPESCSGRRLVKLQIDCFLSLGLSVCGQ